MKDRLSSCVLERDPYERSNAEAPMYSTCMFCNKPLGENQVVETFPVGRRLVFDSERGRLWVVCRKCERWNLSPIEERWEAIESCERFFSETRLKVSTDQVGLARHREGLELVRIGRPQRPEFAAWRYGDQFGRRRKRAMLYGAGGAVVFGGIVIGGMATGVISAALLGQSGNFVNLWVNGRTLATVRAEDGRVLKLKLPELQKAQLGVAPDPDDWSLSLYKGKKEHRFEGIEARRLAGVVVPRINRSGAKTTVVQEAVREIEEAGDPEELLRHAAAIEVPRGQMGPKKHQMQTGMLAKLPQPTRLAVEMALHEEQERRALHGELKALEARWREAEEIAGISDSLLLPEGTDEKLEAWRREEDDQARVSGG